MVVKDKPIRSPLWILSPSRYASSEGFPFSFALGWWALIQALSWLEPVPPELNMQFRWQYLALQHLCAILAQFLLPLAFVFLLPKDLPGGRVRTLWRLSLGASFWYLWTFPLTFVLTGVKATVALELVRPLLWAATVAWVAGASVRSRWLGWVSRPVGILWLFAGSLAFQLIPDSRAIAHFRMDNVGSGRVCPGIPELLPGATSVADWTVAGNPQTVSAERLALGERQKVLEQRPGWVHLRVAVGAPAPPEDTSGSLDTSATDGAPLLDLLERVPSGPDSLRLGALHALVHGAIRYQRTYFPGTPGEILTRGSGDCKAYAQVFCAAARRLGFPAKVVHGLLASPDGYYAHAWVTVRTGGIWHDWDPTSSVASPDARYLRFSAPKEASGVFDGELAIFSLDSIRVVSRSGVDLAP